MTVEYTYFTASGVETQDKEAKNVMAYIADHGSHKNFWVKMCGAKMFDILQMNDISYVRRNTWLNRKVLEPAFRLYIQFLKTKQITYLRKAEREAL